jgi:FkbM family methyltransferase
MGAMTFPIADDAIVITAESRYGRIAHLREDDPIGASLQQYGEWAQLEIDFVLRFVAAGDTVVDAGANVGTHTLAFAQAVGAGGRVLAFEPQPTIFELLQRNAAVNGAGNVIADHRALGRRQGVRYVPAVNYAARLNTGAVSLLADADGAVDSVEVLPLDSLSLDAVRLIKIDVEGMEGEVIAGARDTLDRCRPLLFVECNTVESGTATWEALRGARYLVFFKRSAAFHPNNFRGNPMNRFGAARESNLFCVPQELESAVLRMLANEPELFRIDGPEDIALQLLRTPRYGDPGENGSGGCGPGEAELRDLRAHVTEQRGEIERLNYRLAKQMYQHEQRERRAADELTTLHERLHRAEANAAANAANAAAAAAAEERQRIASDELTARVAAVHAEAKAHAAAFDDQVRRLDDELRAVTERFEARIAEMAEDLGAGAQRNELLAAEIDASEHRFAQTQTDLDAARAQLAEAAERHARLDDECRLRAADLDAERAHAAQRMQELESSVRAAEECRLTVEQLRDELRSRDVLIQSVLSSRSWRLTAPLREMKRLIRPAAPQENV